MDDRVLVPGVECVVCGGPLVRAAGEDSYFCRRCCLKRLPAPRGQWEKLLRHEMMLRGARDVVGDD